jgi:hypothetical protein
MLHYPASALALYTIAGLTDAAVGYQRFLRKAKPKDTGKDKKTWADDFDDDHSGSDSDYVDPWAIKEP